MTNTLLGIALFTVLIVGPFWLIRKMDKHAAQKGPLFTGKPTRGMRVLAIVLGILFAGLFIMEILNSSAIHIWFPILALALLAYGLGTGQLLGGFQKQEGNAYSIPDSSNKKISSVVKRWAILLGVSALVIYGAFWAMTHPNNPLTLWFALGVIILLMFALIGNWLNLFSRSSKHKDQ